MKNKRYLLWAIIIVVLVIGIAVGWYFSNRGAPSPGNNSKYAAVYMQGGDIYFGEISHWPNLPLKRAWYLDRTEEGTGLAPFEGLFWSPSGKLYLNDKQVVWWSYIASDSELARQLEEVEI